MSESHVVRIPSFLYEDLMRCHAARVATNQFPPALVKETVEAWKSTKKGKEVMKILVGERKWFMRLDQMSPKDSPFGGKLPTTTLEHVVVKTCSSMRAWNCLQKEQADAASHNRDIKIELVLNPWDEKMDTTSEFRVFVPPPAARGAADEVREFNISTVDLVCAGANTVLSDISVFVQE